jgi:rubrerythrin
VQCHLCGRWFRFVGSSHLRRTHGWTIAEYREAFRLPRLAPTCGRALSEVQRADATRRIGRDGFGAGGPSRRGAQMPAVPRWRSLVAQSPELLVEWHPTRNGYLDPETVAARSPRPAWWRCSACGHEWQARIAQRTAGHGCPVCGRAKGAATTAARRRSVARERSLGFLRPDLLAEWHSTRNGELDPFATALRSQQRVWWRCSSCGHEWRASVNNRGRHRCPACERRTRGLVERERSLAAREPELLAEWHPTRNDELDPERVAPGSNRWLWWRCSDCGHEWQATAHSRSKGSGCPACRQRRRGARAA